MSSNSGPLRVLLVAGARPNFVKIAPLIPALDARGHETILVHTGQHYDDLLSDAFFEDLGIPAPDHHLGVGSASHARQTALVMESFEPVLQATRPDWVVVVGDVNSTLACALVAAKLKEETGCQIAHVEAGLRSRDWSMPEEINRILTDRLSDLLFTTSPDALDNLRLEGIPAERVVFAGNVMIDTLFRLLPQARATPVAEELGLVRGEFALATVHRPSNVDGRESLVSTLTALAAVADLLPLVLPLHPRTEHNIQNLGLQQLLHPLRVVPPLRYPEMLSLMDAASVVLTDSGGIQEETTALGVPCVTLREQTERPVTITGGTNRLCPWPITSRGLVSSVQAARAEGRQEPGTRCPEGWDGRASERIADALTRFARTRSRHRSVDSREGSGVPQPGPPTHGEPATLAEDPR